MISALDETRQRRALHRSRRGGLSAEAVQPDAAARPHQCVAGAQMAARPGEEISSPSWSGRRSVRKPCCSTSCRRPIVDAHQARRDRPSPTTSPSATILFCRPRRFTPAAARLTPDRAGRPAQPDLLRASTRLAAELGVEKIKTIGDAYMAAAGLPSRAPTTPTRIAAVALAHARGGRRGRRRDGAEAADRASASTPARSSPASSARTSSSTTSGATR